MDQHSRVISEAQPRSGEPSDTSFDKTPGRTHVDRERPLRDEAKSGGNQPANIRVINRRHTGSVSDSTLDLNTTRTAGKQLGRKLYFC